MCIENDGTNLINGIIINSKKKKRVTCRKESINFNCESFITQNC